jgi:signal transduction histidine kinase
VSVSLLCFGTEGEVKLMNQAAKELLDRPFMSHVDILKRVDPVLLEKIKALENGQRALVKVVIKDELRHIALQAKEFKLQGVAYKLVSLQDIRSELDEKEVDTWQKLIRVLTHEIMNSVTPIISLTKVINLLMTGEDGQRKDLREIDAEDADDMLNGIRTIESRSKGLLHFVHAYRSLTKIQKPKFGRVHAKAILEQVVTLLKPELERRNITVHCQGLPDYPYIQADAELIEQVLINLVKNAMEALEGREHGRIELTAGKYQDERYFIQVKDNGPGIDEEYIDRIFIPFFTTKRKGSGIGLSLSRQIMRMHKGSINLYSSPEEGTIFTLVF